MQTFKRQLNDTKHFTNSGGLAAQLNTWIKAEHFRLLESIQ